MSTRERSKRTSWMGAYIPKWGFESPRAVLLAFPPQRQSLSLPLASALLTRRPGLRRPVLVLDVCAVCPAFFGMAYRSLSRFGTLRMTGSVFLQRIIIFDEEHPG